MLRNGAPKVRRRLAGAAVLVCAFFLAASGAFAYFSAPAELPAAQTASVQIPIDAFAGTSIEAEGAYVDDLTTGRVLFALNPDAQLPLASITKIATVLAVSEVLPPDTVFTVPETNTSDMSTPSLTVGDQWHLQDVIDFTLVVSSNEGADVLAHIADAAVRARYPQAPVGGAVLWRMNDLAQQLGLSRTYFLDDNGLDFSTSESGAYGSPRDVAALFAYAASTSPSTFAATAEPALSLTSINGHKITAVNTDLALASIPGLIMSKTGYTDLAGGNLAVVFDVDGHRLVAVVLHSTENGRFTDVKTLVADSLKAVQEESVAGAR